MQGKKPHEYFQLRGTLILNNAICSWEKAWRAACWAALGNATQAQYELQLTIQRDFEVRAMDIQALMS
jgi:hypothetical protein